MRWVEVRYYNPVTNAAPNRYPQLVLGTAFFSPKMGEGWQDWHKCDQRKNRSNPRILWLRAWALGWKTWNTCLNLDTRLKWPHTWNHTATPVAKNWDVSNPPYASIGKCVKFSSVFGLIVRGWAEACVDTKLVKITELTYDDLQTTQSELWGLRAIRT